MTPIPLIKPETTGWGTNSINLPIFKKPKSIWNKPPIMTTVKARAAPVSGSLGNSAVY